MKRCARLALVAALLYGTGAHWAAVQGLAWARMIAARAPRQGLAEAVGSTFDGKSPCGVCLVVERAAKPEAPAGVAAPSVHFIAVGPVAAPAPVLSSAPVPALAPRPPSSSSRPDSPPPRAALPA